MFRIRVVGGGDLKGLVHDGDLLGVDDRLADETIQPVQCALLRQPLRPAGAVIILPDRPGHKIVRGKGGEQIGQYVCHRAQVIDRVPWVPAQAEDVAEVVAAHPDIEDALAQRVQLGLDLRQSRVAGVEGEHRRGLKDGHIEVIQPIRLQVSNNGAVGSACFYKKFGQNKPGEQGTVLPIRPPQPGQLLRRAHPDESQGAVKRLLPGGICEVVQGLFHGLLCRRQGVGPHRVFQAQGQGEGVRQALRRHRLGDGVVGVGGAVEQGAHVVSADVLGHGGSTSFPTEINTIVSHTVALTSRKMRNTRKRGILY